MQARKLPGWSKRQLQVTMLLFFFALAVPTGILMQQAYSQLKWEAFYRHRVMAEELVKRIDHRVKKLIAIESARTYTDYSFLNITGDARANLLQRSPLAQYPVNPTIPGMMGYFQIDHLGRFSSPLLPEPALEGDKALQQYGLNNDELVARKQISNQIYQLLNDNKLLASSLLEDQNLTHTIQAMPISSAAVKHVETGLSLDEEQLERDITDTDTPTASVLESKAIDSSVAQFGFDRLKKADRRQLKNNQAGQALGRLTDLKLENRYREKLSAARSVAEQEKTEATSKARIAKQKPFLRKEQNVLPLPIQENLAARVNIFESEIDTFELGLLDSGHFVLYRNVWRDGQRRIQGMLITIEPFLRGLVADFFLQTNLAQSSDLTTAYQGNVLSVLRGSNAGRYLSSTQELQGSLLLQNRLSAPLDALELVFSIHKLPAGPGATVLNWLSIVLLLVMAGGFMLMYRLGLGQIKLAQQQQNFVSAVSHELKTPLTSIHMYSEILREGWASEEKKSTYYDYIYEESDRLSRLINNVLQLANLTQNDINIELKPHSVAQLVDTLHSKISSQIEQAGFELNINVGSHSADHSNREANKTVLEKFLIVDEDYFCQIAINLVDNAIKFSKNASQHRIDIDFSLLSNDRLQFSLRDYGPGIQPDQMRQVFQLFYRSENELSRETAGTGIGLALVDQLTRAMDGKIDVMNTNPGARFSINFPVLLSE